LHLSADLIVASAGDDKKISLWHKKGHNVGQLPTSSIDRGDDIEVSVYYYFLDIRPFGPALLKKTEMYWRICKP
jgi:hypothetical protein